MNLREIILRGIVIPNLIGNLKAHCITIPACAGMTILVLESADLILVERHLFAFYLEVFNYATIVLNLMILTALSNRKKE